MAYDNLDDGHFNGVRNTSIVYDDCVYQGNVLDSNGEGHGNLVYRNGKSFEGICQNGKPKEGILSFVGTTKELQTYFYTCKVRNFLPHEGTLLNEKDELEHYKKGYKVNVPFASRSLLIAAGAALASVAGLSYTLNLSDTKINNSIGPQNPPEEVTNKTGLSDSTSSNEPLIIHDEYRPEGKTAAELKAEYGDLTKECSSEDELRIKVAQNWLDRNIGQVDFSSDQIWKSPENSWKRSLITSQTSFPDQYQFQIAGIYNAAKTARFVCPGVSNNYFGLSNFDEKESIAIYEGSFADPCTTVNTLLHEILHKNTGWEHPYDSEFTQADWIYYAGDLAEDLCREGD